MPDVRGVQLLSPFADHDKAAQLIDFSGLGDGRVHPTDIDQSYDKHGRIFLFGEFKYDYAPVPRGQEIHLENLVNAISDGGRICVAYVADHHVRDPHKEVHAKDCIIRSIYTGKNRRWRMSKSGKYTVADLFEAVMAGRIN